MTDTTNTTPPPGRAEIRRLAHEHAARELRAVAEHWDVPERLGLGPEQREAFELEVLAICRRIERGATRRPTREPS